MAGQFSVADAEKLLGEVFAPWVRDLGIAVERLEEGAPEPGAVLRMAFSERLCREGGVICGQALMALADTAMVLAVSVAARGFRPMTTVDQTTHFLKPVSNSAVFANARIARLGRTMAFGRVSLTASDGKPVAMVSSAYALL